MSYLKNFAPPLTIIFEPIRIKTVRKQLLLFFAIGLFWAVDYHSLPYAAEPANPLLKEGEDLYQKNCSVCHGDKGDGKTWVSNGLNPPPKNFTDPKVIKTLTKKRMIQSITDGREGTPMQPFKTQLSKKEIELVVDYIRAVFMKIDAKAGKKK